MNKNRLKFRYWNGERFIFSNQKEFAFLGDSCIIGNTDTVNFTYINQFTGLFDTDGIEIYEGDIIKSSYEDPYGEEGALIHNHYEVLFYCGEFEINSAEYSIGINGFCIKKIKTTSEDHQYSLGQIYPLAKEIKKRNYGAFGLDAAKSEIVGNIFENKDLLK